MIVLAGFIVSAALEDVDGPLIYEVDILPVQPVAGDMISVVIYCIDKSGVSAAQLSSSLDGESWTIQDMHFYTCLCIAGGRWVAVFGPVNEGDEAQFFVTAFDNAPIQHSSSTQNYSIQLTTV
jgi:hypothetical protein